MSFAAYVRSSWPQVAAFTATSVLSAFMLAVAAVPTALIVMVVGAIVVALAASLVGEYARRASFCRTLEECSSPSDCSLWVAEMVDRPDYLEGQITYDAVCALAKAANDRVAASRRTAEGYREYVETWVHEAKSPLAAASLMLENMMRDAPADQRGAQLIERTEALGEELQRVEGYIEQALYFARSESLDRDYLVRSYALADLVTSAIKANSRPMIVAHVRPVLQDLSLTVFTDEKWMTFVLGQIIQNSVKYACASAPRIEFSGKLVNEGLSNEAVELTVADNGRGVGEADLPRVFDRGFTGENGRVGKRATGMGLYLVKSLCDKMGLSVRAASAPGEGFAVTISFPTNKMHYFE